MHLKRLISALAAFAMLALAPSASASTSTKQYVLKHPSREQCKVQYDERVERVSVRRHGHSVKVRETVCVYAPPKKARAK